MNNSTAQNNQPTAKEILEEQVIHIKRGRMNKFGFEPAWNAYFDFYLSDKYLKRPILKLEDVTFHLFLRKNLNDDDPTWKMPSFPMMKRRFGIGQNKIEGMLDRLTKAHLLKKVSGKRKGDKGADIANTYELSDPIQNLEEFLVVAAASEFLQPLKEKWKEALEPPLPKMGKGGLPEMGKGALPKMGNHEHTSYKQTSTTNNNVVDEKSPKENQTNTTDPEQPTITALVEQLIEQGVAKTTAKKLATPENVARIQYTLELFAYLQKTNPQAVEKNPAGWIVKAIKAESPYYVPGFKTKAQREAEAAERKAREAEQARQVAEMEQAHQAQHEQVIQEQAQRLAALEAAHGVTDELRALRDRLVSEVESRLDSQSRPIFHPFLANLSLLPPQDDVIRIVLPHPFARDQVRKRFGRLIQRLLEREQGTSVTLKFITLDDH